MRDVWNTSKTWKKKLNTIIYYLKIHKDAALLHERWFCSLWVATLENIPSVTCTHQRLKSGCTTAQSDLNLRCLHEEALRRWLSKMRPVKILIRLRECAVWSESSLCAHVQRYLFSCYVKSRTPYTHTFRSRILSKYRKNKKQEVADSLLNHLFCFITSFFIIYHSLWCFTVEAKYP